MDGVEWLGDGEKVVANNFSGDANCYALWKLDSIAAGVTPDGKGDNDLTVVGAAGPVIATGAADHKEGAGAAYFDYTEGDQALYIADSSLGTGFPFKSGDSTKKISICFWFRSPSDTSEAGYVFSKYDTEANKRSIGITMDWSTNNSVTLWLGTGTGDAGTAYPHGSTITADRWYHVGITYDNADYSYRIRIWDDTAGEILGTDATGNHSGSVPATDAGLYIGTRNDMNREYGGLIDELVVFDDVLTTAEIDSIRAGTYRGVAGSPRRSGRRKYQHLLVR